MIQNDQTGFLKKNRYRKNSVLIMASFSMVLGCGLQKSQSNNAPESKVKNDKSIEEELKEQSSTNQENKTEKEITKDHLVSFVLSKGLLPKDTDTKTLKFADLGSFTGNESQCSFYERASSYVCVDKEVVYTDSAVGGVERFGHFRVPSPHIRNVIPAIPNPLDAVQKEIENKARSLAEAFHNTNPNANQQDCIVMVAAGLAAWGAASGAGPIGAAVTAGGGVAAAGIACRAWYP